MSRRSVLDDATFHLSSPNGIPYFALDGRLFDLTTGKELPASLDLYKRMIMNGTEVTLEQALQRTQKLALSGAKTTKAAVLAWLRVIRRRGKNF